MEDSAQHLPVPPTGSDVLESQVDDVSWGWLRDGEWLVGHVCVSLQRSARYATSSAEIAWSSLPAMYVLGVSFQAARPGVASKFEAGSGRNSWTARAATSSAQSAQTLSRAPAGSRRVIPAPSTFMGNPLERPVS